MRKLYVCSKNMGGDGARLIGILSEEEGKYQFEYRLGGILHEWFLKIEEFPDLSRIYLDAEVRPFVERIIPRRESRYIHGFLKAAELEQYDEWEFLKYCGAHNMREDAYLYECLPDGVIRYD